MGLLSPFARFTASVLVITTIAGCSVLAPSKTDLSLVSADRPAALSPRFTTAVFFSGDPNEADLFLTDLPPERLADPNDTLADAAGSLLHVHLFVIPAAGSTPMDPTACNVALRYVVLSGGAVGVYSGGGFLYPSGKTASANFGGSLAGGSLRLTRATPDFLDVLGPALLEGSLSAARDPRAAAALRARLESLYSGARPLSADAPKKSASARSYQESRGGAQPITAQVAVSGDHGSR
jgi:hypothetical protein